MPHAVLLPASKSYKPMKDSSGPSRLSLRTQSISSLQDRLSPLSVSSNILPQKNPTTTETPVSFSTFNFRRLSSTPQPQSAKAIPALLGRMQERDPSPSHHVEHIRISPRLPGSVTSFRASGPARSGGLALQRFSGSNSSTEPITFENLETEPAAVRTVPSTSRDVDINVSVEEKPLPRPHDFQPNSQPQVALKAEPPAIPMSTPVPYIKSTPIRDLTPSPLEATTLFTPKVDLSRVKQSSQESVSALNPPEILDAYMDKVLPESVQSTIPPPNALSVVSSLFKLNPYEGTRFALPNPSSMEAVYAEAQQAQSEWAKHADDMRLAKTSSEQKPQEALTEHLAKPQTEAPSKAVVPQPNPPPDLFAGRLKPSPSLTFAFTRALPNTSPTQAPSTPAGPLHSGGADSNAISVPSARTQQDLSSATTVQMVQSTQITPTRSARDVELQSPPSNRKADSRIRNAAAAVIMRSSPDSSSSLPGLRPDLSKQDPKPVSASDTQTSPHTAKYSSTNDRSALPPNHSIVAAPMRTSTIGPGKSQPTSGVKRKAASPTNTPLQLDNPAGRSPAGLIQNEPRTADPSQAVPQSTFTKTKDPRVDGRHALPPIPAPVISNPDESSYEAGARKRPRVEAPLAAPMSTSGGDARQTSLQDAQTVYPRNLPSLASPPSSPLSSQVPADRRQRRSPSPYRDDDKCREGHQTQILRTRGRYASAPGNNNGPGIRGRRPVRSRSPRQAWAETERRVHYPRYQGSGRDFDRYLARSPFPTYRHEDDAPYRGRRYPSRSPSPRYQHRYDHSSHGRSASPPRREFYDSRSYAYDEDRRSQPQQQVQSYDSSPSPPPRERYHPAPRERPISLYAEVSGTNFHSSKVHQSGGSDNHSHPNASSRSTYDRGDQAVSSLRHPYRPPAHLPLTSATGVYNWPLSDEQMSPKRLPDPMLSAPTRRTAVPNLWNAHSSLHDYQGNSPVSTQAAISSTHPTNEHRESSMEADIRPEQHRTDTLNDLPSLNPTLKPMSGPTTERSGLLLPNGVSLASRMADSPSQAPPTLESRISDARRPASNERPPPKRTAPSLMARMN